MHACWNNHPPVLRRPDDGHLLTTATCKFLSSAALKLRPLLMEHTAQNLLSSPQPPSRSHPPPPQHGRREERQHAVAFEMSDDLSSCLVTLLTFLFFASAVLILGVFGPVDLVLAPNCSRILPVNSFFVQDITVKTVKGSDHGVMLYGFQKPPPLDEQITWSETYNVSVPANFHKEWIYYLNEHAQVNISYSVRSNTSQPLILVIAQGTEGLHQWIEQPSLSNIPLAWTTIHGNGVIQQNITKSSYYYIAVGNLNQQEMEVQLSFRLQTPLHNTTGAYYKCSLGHSSCNLKIFFLRKNVAIITSPGPQQGMELDEWYVKVSYGPRWLTYFGGSGTVTVAILLLFNIFTRLLVRPGNGASPSNADFEAERSPLLPTKEDDAVSLGSSYDSVSHDEGDIEENLELLDEGEADKTRRLCTICCDAQRDSFFLPCGHCATCFACGTRVADEAGTCPICRRRMKKVKMIFMV